MRYKHKLKAEYAVSPEVTSDVETLVEKTIMTEVGVKVWDKFERALASLDSQSAELIAAYFSGQSVEVLAANRNLSQDEVRTWLNKLKRSLVQELKKECKIRQ